MKKLISVTLLLGIVFLMSGCNSLNDSTIYTTVYPIHFLTETLYGEHASISSIYPSGADVTNYELTDKLINEYSTGTLFIYNGTTEEKQIAKTLVNKRKKLKIIDAAYSLKYKYGMEELWLSPSNYLMLATNLKDGLEEQIGTKYLNEEINKKYQELEETLSIMDADMRSIAKDASNRGQNTIIVSSNILKFLEDYGFKVISLEDYQDNKGNVNSLKNSFKSGTYKYILQTNKKEMNDLVSEIKSQSGATVLSINLMQTLTEENQKNNDTYFTIMNEFISNLKTITNY